MHRLASVRLSRGWLAALAAVLALPVATQAAENIILGTYTSGASPTFVSSTINLRLTEHGRSDHPDLRQRRLQYVPGLNLNLTIQDGGQEVRRRWVLQFKTFVDILTGTIFSKQQYRAG